MIIFNCFILTKNYSVFYFLFIFSINHAKTNITPILHTKINGVLKNHAGKDMSEKAIVKVLYRICVKIEYRNFPVYSNTIVKNKPQYMPTIM